MTYTLDVWWNWLKNDTICNQMTVLLNKIYQYRINYELFELHLPKWWWWGITQAKLNQKYLCTISKENGIVLC